MGIQMCWPGRPFYPRPVPEDGLWVLPGCAGPPTPLDKPPPPCPANMPVFLVFPTSDDDIVFEDFARQRLKGMKDDKEEEEDGTGSPRLNDR